MDGASIIYIMSQVAVVIQYILLAYSYQLKDHKKILVVNFSSLVVCAISYLLLQAWTGLALTGVAAARNIYFLVLDKKKGKKKNAKYTTADYIALAIFLIFTGVSTYFTATNAMDVLFGIATMALTYSLWQKNPRVYKILGLPISAVRIGYNISINSIFGIILESVFFIAVTIGTIRDFKDEKKKKIAPTKKK